MSVALTTTNAVPSVVIDPDGYIYMTYYTTYIASLPANNLDILVYKMDMLSNVIWIVEQATLYAYGAETAPIIALDATGEIYVSYTTVPDMSNNIQIVIMKLSQLNGGMLWQLAIPTIEGTDDLHLQAIAADSYLYLVYTADEVVSGGTTLGLVDLVVVKMSLSNGAIIWQKQEPIYNTAFNDMKPSITLDTLGNLYVIYQTYGIVSGGTSQGLSDIAVFKMDTNGNILWIKQSPSFNTAMDDLNPTITTDAAGNVYMAYTTGGVTSGQSQTNTMDVVVTKLLGTDGSTQWVIQNPIINAAYIGPGLNPMPVITINHKYGYVVVAYQTTGVASGQTATGGSDIVFFQLNPTTGACLNIHQSPDFNTPVEDVAPSIASNEDGAIFIAFETYSTVNDITLNLYSYGDQQIPCFNHDTKILCYDQNMVEVYRPIQELTKGMYVKTYNEGPKEIIFLGTQIMYNNPDRWVDCMYRYPKEKGMIDDLIITGGHSILINRTEYPDDLARQKTHLKGKVYKIKDKYMLFAGFCSQFQQITNQDIYRYYHIVLDDDNDPEKHYGIWANGVLTESQSRMHFLQHNYIHY